MESLAGNVVLTGFMGTGKTTVGQALADLLDFAFLDTDQLIEADHGPIPLIFAEHGQETFRTIEREVTAELAARSGLVIATGGGLMLDAENARQLEATGRVFCLTAPVEVILERVVGDGTADRPLLQTDDPAARIQALLSERADVYRRFEQVDTQHRTPDRIAADINTRLAS